ncbi:MAG: ribulose-phosphate 3-epimerase [Nitrososphaerales archaeon]
MSALASQQSRPIKIAPSILAYDLSDLAAGLEIASRGGADQIHLDVIDGRFAPNITFGPGTVKALRSRSRMKFDTHLMISEPRLYVERFIDAGSDLLTFQAEVLDAASFDALASIVRSRGKEMGLALRPETALPGWAEDRLGALSAILLLTVNPGFSGQAMDRSVLPKIERVRRLADERGLALDIEVDGGIDAGNVQEVAGRGGNVFVAGAGVYGRPDPAGAIGELRARAAVATRGGAV